MEQLKGEKKTLLWSIIKKWNHTANLIYTYWTNEQSFLIIIFRDTLLGFQNLFSERHI